MEVGVAGKEEELVEALVVEVETEEADRNEKRAGRSRVQGERGVGNELEEVEEKQRVQGKKGVQRGKVEGSGWRKAKGVEEKGIEVLVAEEVGTAVTGDGRGKNAEEAWKELVEEGKRVEGRRTVEGGLQGKADEAKEGPSGPAKKQGEGEEKTDVGVQDEAKRRDGVNTEEKAEDETAGRRNEKRVEAQGVQGKRVEGVRKVEVKENKAMEVKVKEICEADGEDVRKDDVRKQDMRTKAEGGEPRNEKKEDVRTQEGEAVEEKMSRTDVVQEK
jgi:hypothetical protein